MRLKFATTVSALSALQLASLVSPAAAQTPATSRRVLPIATALEAARVALADCASKGYLVSVAVVDTGGDLKLLAADPGVSPISIELSQRKARAAALFNSKSSEVGARFQAGPGFGQLMMSIDPRISGAQGALPIVAGKDPVGAIGISGAAGGAADEACATAGLAAVANALK